MALRHNERLKLVFSAEDDPWLYDLSKDPDEMDNRIGLQEHAAAVRQMTKELAAYCKQYKDPYGEVREIKTAMEKVLGGK